MVGVSFKRYLTGETLQPPRSRYGVELHNQAARIDGDWKLRRLVKPSRKRGRAVGLFNLKQDPLETHDLATQYPQRVQTMSQDYAAFAGRTMVVHADGKAIDYVGIDAKTGRYLAVDPQTMKPVAAPLAIPAPQHD